MGHLPEAGGLLDVRVQRVMGTESRPDCLEHPL